MANLHVNFMFGTREKFNALAVKDADTLYFVEGLLYKGNVLYGGAHELVTAYPATGKQGVLYCNTTDLSVKIWTGSAYHTVVPPIVTAINGSVTNAQLAGAKAIKDYVDNLVTGGLGGLGALAAKDKVAEADLDTTLAGKINAKAETSDVTALSGKVTTLIGADTGKSARTIANEELAA